MEQPPISDTLHNTTTSNPQPSSRTIPFGQEPTTSAYTIRPNQRFYLHFSNNFVKLLLATRQYRTPAT